MPVVLRISAKQAGTAVAPTAGRTWASGHAVGPDV